MKQFLLNYPHYSIMQIIGDAFVKGVLVYQVLHVNMRQTRVLQERKKNI